MVKFTENSLADVVKVFRYLEPSKDDAVLIEALVGLLGFTMKREVQLPPPSRMHSPSAGPENLDDQPKPPSQNEVEQPLPKKRRSSSELQLKVLNDPHGNSMPDDIQEAVALWDEEPEMPTVLLINNAPSIPLLPVTRARSYIHDTFSSETCLGELDVDELIEQMARGVVPTITNVRKKLLRGPVHVMIDRNRSMEPFEYDADQIYQYISSLVGRDACEGYWCFDTPDDKVFCMSDNKSQERYPLKLLPQTLLVLISDLGASHPFGWSPVPRHRWSDSLKRLAKEFSRVVVVSPYSKKRLPVIRTSNIEIVPWGKNRYACSGDEETVLHDLATMIAPAAYLNRDIIRSARANFYPGCYPGIEADLIFSWRMAVSNPLVLSFRPETQSALREALIKDERLRKMAYDFLYHYREHTRQFILPEWIKFEEELIHHSLNGEREEVDGKVRRLIRSLIEFEEYPRLARWALSVSTALPKEHVSPKEFKELRIAAELRLGVVSKEFEQSGNESSWLLPKATTIGIRQDVGQLRFVDNPSADDIRISVPGTVPRFLKIEGSDGSVQTLVIWKGRDDVMASEQLLPLTISTLSGAKYRLGEPEEPLRQVKILIASQGDVAKEREIVSEEIEKWNFVNKYVHRIVLEAVRWETDAPATISERPQEIINQQIVDQCDFAIAIFHTRIGTNTGVAPGGAVEEVRRIINQGKTVMCWFSEIPVSTQKIYAKQLDTVMAFRKEMEQHGFIDSYNNLNEFRQKVAYQLALYLSKLYGVSPVFQNYNKIRDKANAALVRYKEYLRRLIESISLKSSPVIESFSVSLSDVFVPLRLSDIWLSKERFLSDKQDGFHTRYPDELLRRVFRNHRLLLIIGDPGSGKSTLLNYYALLCLDSKHESLGFTAPVPVIKLQLREIAFDKSLLANIAIWCNRNNLSEISQEYFAEWLETSETLVLLDGFDEIQDVNDRIKMCHWIDQMVKHYGHVRIVVTSRSTGYRKVDGIEIGTPHVRADIMDFTEEQQEEFLAKWFRAAYLRELCPPEGNPEAWIESQKKAAAERTRTIVEYLGKPENRGLRELSAVPMMLQIMAILWKEREFLPGKQVTLYSAALDYLLEYRDDRRKIPPLLPADKARLVLAPVALWMQEKLEADEAERTAMHSEMEKVLNTLDHPPSPEAFCRNLIDRAGLLVEYGDARKEYRFRHKTFREYLAGSQLTEKIKRNSGLIAPLVEHFGEDWWNEPLTFFMAQSDGEMFDRFMEALFESEVSAEFSSKQQTLLQTIITEAPQKKCDALIMKLFDSATSPGRQRYLVDCLKAIGTEDALYAVRRFEQKADRYPYGNTEAPLRLVKVLIASPSDVAEERKIVADEIGKWNIVNRDLHGIDLEAVIWETHAHLDSAGRRQELLNLQIVDQCDFMIAIFHSRIGTDTGLAPGGAVEEVRRMMAQKKTVMCWFSYIPVSPQKIESGQLDALNAFRKEIEERALVDSYNDLNDFRQKVTHQLALYLSRQYGIAAVPGVDGQRSNESYKALMSYQEYLKHDFGTMILSGSPAIASFSVALSDTFVSLRLSDTWRSEGRFHGGAPDGVIPDGNRVRTPEEVMTLVFRKHRLLLVIGDPGSGKTTLLKYYALLCLEGRHEAFGFTSPVPVFWLPLRTLRRTGQGYGSLAANLAGWCGVNYLDEITQEQCAEWLEASKTLILLDGLDEISDVNDRIEMCRWIDGMVKKYGNARFVVTSRSTGYRKGDGIEIVTPHVRADIMDFSPEQQEQFLHKWFRAAYLRELPLSGVDEVYWRKTQKEKADQKAAAITAFLAEDRNRSIRTLAGVPLLLQIMALLWKEHEYLPGNRGDLIDSALDYMLDYRDRQRAINPLLSADDARRVLAPVALWMQEEVKQDEVNREAMYARMDVELSTLNTKVTAPAFCRNLVDRAGVLVEYGDNQYLFRLKAFREYLAAVQLDRNIMRTVGFIDNLVQHFCDDWWSEVFRFFIEQLGDAEFFERIMVKLFDSSVIESLTPKQQELLLTLVREAPQKQYSELIKKLFDPLTSPNRQCYLVECLRTIGKEDALDAVRRFEAKEASHLFINSCELDAHYILIRGGSFTYSVANKKETMPDFWIAKYPVSNRLYRRFISYLKMGKIDDREVISVEGFKLELTTFAEKNGLNEYLRMIQSDKGLAEEFASSYDQDEHDISFNYDDQPVVGITWYAAKAYCLWLSLMESQGKNVGLYRLPTEIEWEYAAAGKEGRAYPWGNGEPSPKLANYDNHERATTPIGRYPDGATPEGLYDMGGNVAEWTENWFDKAKRDRALRGGSWGVGSKYLRCSARINFDPADWHNQFGFRVVRPSPFLNL